MRRDKLDALFSNLIREAYNWTCCRCGKYFPEGSRQGIHCSHLYSRRHQTTRHYPLNAVAHCYTCHSWYGSNPIEGGHWARNFIGDGAVNILRDRLNRRTKYTKVEKEEIYQHYKKEAERIKKLRMAGETGTITITPYD